MADRYLEMKNISKTYPGVRALSGVSLGVGEGEAVALLGENGAGKSTLMNVLGGLIKCDEGTILINGKTVHLNTVSDAQRHGIAYIHQELSLFTRMKVYENLFIDDMQTKAGFPVLDKELMVRESEKVLKQMGIDVPGNAVIKDLPIGQQQIIEIAAAVLKRSKIIILDEPTTSLTNKERDKLFAIVEMLRSEKKCIIFITHDLDDALNHCDRCYVLRNGQNAGDDSCADIDREGIIQLMIGEKAGKKFAKTNRTILDEKILEVKNLCTDKVKDVSFSLKKGEVLGLYGLVGSGRSEIIHALYGIDKIQSGEVIVKGERVNKASPAIMKTKGFGYLTENRRDDGLFLTLPIFTNITITAIEKIKDKLGLISRKKDLWIADEMIEKLHISTPGNAQLAGKLSGGNQQKVIIGKWLHLGPEVFILDEPTKGIDVGAKKEIYTLIDQIANEGTSILLISSEIEEIIGMSDRVGIMANGQMAGFLENDEINEDNIIHYTMS